MAPPERDAVEDILEQWKRLRPDLDLQAMGIIGRIGRFAAIGSRQIAAGLERHGLQIGEFDVLAALWRSGEPYRLTPGQLSRAMMLSSGAMTNRLDRLEAAGLIRREDDPQDRRGIRVALTPAGLVLAGRAVSDHVAGEAALLKGLTRSERGQLNLLMRKLLLSLEQRAPAQGSRDRPGDAAKP
jgi:DNA-binding MarR family transcriptional regulator